MTRLPSFRPTYASVMATAAMFVALGGTSYAAVKLAANSVGEKHLKNGAVTSPKLAAGAVTADKLAAGVAATGARGPRGVEGPAGPQGGAGPQGPQGVAKVYVNRDSSIKVVPPSLTTYASLRLPAGSYSLTFSAHMFSLAATTFIDCSMLINGATPRINGSTVSIGADAPGAIEQAMAITEVTTLTAAATVTVACAQRGTNFEAKIVDTRLTAMPVGSIEVQ